MTGFQRRLDARLVLSIVAIGVMSFAGVVVETAMNIAFPALMTEFGVSTARVQWITTGYLLVLAAIMLISSLLNRRFRTRSLFLTAMALFVAGTVLCATAPRFDLLIGGRLIQGVGTGIALPLMFNVVLKQAPLDRLGTMMGVATLITAIAPAVGPSLGGYLIGALGWRSIFLILLPFLLAALLLGALTIREAHEPERVPFAPVQFAALAAGFTCFVLAMNAASTAGFASARVLVLTGCAAALVGAFCALSRRSHAPLLRIGVFADRTFALSILYVVLVQGIVLALGYLIPYYAQVGAGAGSFAAGCLLLPGCVVGACLTPFGGRILDRLGPAHCHRRRLRRDRHGPVRPSRRAGRDGAPGLDLPAGARVPGAVHLEFDDSRPARPARRSPGRRQRRLQHRPAARRRHRDGGGDGDRQCGAGGGSGRPGGGHDGGDAPGLLAPAGRHGRRGAPGGRRGPARGAGRRPAGARGARAVESGSWRAESAERSVMTSEGPEWKDPS